MGYAILILLILFLLYLLAIGGRVGYPRMKQLQGYNYAHRGLHGNGVPENSMAAFKAAKKRGYGIELDLHLLKDGSLAVFHDSSLKRTTGAEGIIEDLTAEDLANYKLEGTEQTIPTFEQVLNLYAGTAPIIVELKPVNKNHAALAKAACKALVGYKGAYCIESFDPRCLLWLKKNRPSVVRGQLSQNFFRGEEKLSFIIKFILTNHLMNFLTQPDFIAYRFEHRKGTISNYFCKKWCRMQFVAWTVRDKETQAAVQKAGWLSIFENFLP